MLSETSGDLAGAAVQLTMIPIASNIKNNLMVFIFSFDRIEIESARMTKPLLWRPITGSLICFNNAEHNRSLRTEADCGRRCCRVSPNPRGNLMRRTGGFSGGSYILAFPSGRPKGISGALTIANESVQEWLQLIPPILEHSENRPKKVESWN